MISSLTPGERLGLVVDALGRNFEGTVTAVAPAADPQSRVFAVEVTIANPDGQLRPGMIGSISVGPRAASRRARTGSHAPTDGDRPVERRLGSIRRVCHRAARRRRDRAPADRGARRGHRQRRRRDERHQSRRARRGDRRQPSRGRPGRPHHSLIEDVMTDHQHEQQAIERTHNTARFFVETRHVAWVLLVGTMLWGIYGYLQMPQRKDPDIPIRQALVLCSVAWRQRGEDRAARHAADRGRGRRERQRREDRVEHAHRRDRGLHHAGPAARRHRQGVRRHQAEAGHHRRPARRRRSDRLHQGLRRHGRADADRGEPADRQRRAGDPCIRRAERD